MWRTVCSAECRRRRRCLSVLLTEGVPDQTPRCSIIQSPDLCRHDMSHPKKHVSPMHRCTRWVLDILWIGIYYSVYVWKKLPLTARWNNDQLCWIYSTNPSGRGQRKHLQRVGPLKKQKKVDGDWTNRLRVKLKLPIRVFTSC